MPKPIIDIDRANRDFKKPNRVTITQTIDHEYRTFQQYTVVLTTYEIRPTERQRRILGTKQRFTFKDIGALKTFIDNLVSGLTPNGNNHANTA